VTSIDNYAFDGCRFLTIYAEPINKPDGWHINWSGRGPKIIWRYKDKKTMDLNTTFNLKNGQEMKREAKDAAFKIMPMLNEWALILSMRSPSAVSMSNYPIELTDSQAYEVENIVENKRDGKFLLANYQYIQLIKKGPISWALLSSWAKVLLCLSIVDIAEEVALICELILLKRGKRTNFSRSYDMLTTLQSRNRIKIRELIIEYSGIPNFEPLDW
jgi:hypothetical protein